jgi:uncharacterized protein YfaS (alpha-2-macroglobulin family)
VSVVAQEAAMRRLVQGLSVVIQALRRALRFLFGRFTWDPPPWLAALGRTLGDGGRWIREHRARSTAVLLAVLLLAGGGALVGRWYLRLPKPALVKVTVTPPGPTPMPHDDRLRPRPLVVDFDTSVAPLKQIGKVVTSGVSLYPRLEGTWRWVSDQRLQFVPRDDWAVGQRYELTLARRDLVATHVRLDGYRHTFHSAPFLVTIDEAVFHQDPTDQNLKKVVATLAFSHPVDPSSFESRLGMRILPSDQEDRETSPRFRVTYDKGRWHAYVHSDPIDPPRKDAVLVLALARGARAARGGPSFAEPLTAKVTVPGIYNFLKVAATRVALVDNERFEPEQVLFVETTVGVTDGDLARAVTASLLPDRDEKNEPVRWHDVERIDDAVLARGRPVPLRAVASEKEYDQAHGFELEAPVGRQLYVRVNRGLRGFGGYLLGDVFQAIVEVPPYPRQLKLLHSGALLALGGERKVSLYARDVPAVRIEIGRVLPRQLHHLVALNHGSFAQPSFSYVADQHSLAEFFREVRPLPAARPGKPQYEAIDLARYIEGAGVERRGLFVLRIESWDPENERPLGEADQRLVLVSNLGVLAKENADGTHEVFVQSIQTGQPVAGAKVSLLGLNGLPVFTETTDGEGHARFPRPEGLTREKTPTLFMVTSGADQSFLPYGRRDRLIDTSRFDVGGVREEGPTKGLNAYLFSDRGLYRPGDEIRVGLIVKSRDWAGRLEGLPLEVHVTDARGLLVKRQRLRLPAAGFEEIRHTTPEVAPTGTYTVGVYVVKNDRQDTLLGSTTVEVREFLPDRMKIRVALSTESPEGWVSPKDLEARVTLANLFGTPATERRVRAALTLSPWFPMFGKLREYTFFDPMRAKEGVSETLADVKTNDAGEAELDLDLGRFAPATYRLRLVVEGFEPEGGRSVTAEVSSVVSPLPFLVGYKPDGDLGYLKRGSDHAVELIAIDPRGARTQAAGLTAVLLERRYVSVLVRQDNGTYRYESKRKEIERGRKPLEVPAGGRKWKLPTETPGDYLLSIRNARDEEQQRIEFAVTGFGNLSRDLEKNAELKLALARADVEAGGELEMQIKAPFTGAGLITVERDKVYAWKWFRAETTASVETIRVPEGLEGGGYVSVSFIRDPGSPEVFMSPLSHGVVPFSISRARRKLALEVKAPEAMKPGEPLRLRYKADRAAKVVLFAVDEGILRVAGYQTPDPLGFFFQKRALGVRTTQILDMILPEYQRLMEALAPGGDEEAAVGANLNPFRRRQHRPVACWSGIVDAGTREKTVDCDVPDHFNGTLRVMAVAVAPDALAAFEDRTLVRGDFVITPNVPTFLAPGDETDVTVAVTNAVIGSGKEARVSLALETGPGLEIVGERERALTIAELREAATSFKVRARPPLGSQRLTFTASMGGKRARLTTDLSVRPAAAYMTTFSAGHMRDREAQVPVTRQMYAEYRTLEAGISYLPLGLAHGLVGYLEKFPHGCTEQVVSQAIPAVALARHPEFGFDQAKAEAAVGNVLELLRTRLNEEGAFGRWAANPEVDRVATVWAAVMMLEARQRGFAVPGDMLKAVLGYLQGLASQDPEDLPGARLQAQATWALTLAGQNTARFVAAQVKHLEANHKAVWRGDVAGLYLAAASRQLRQERIVPGVLDAQKIGKPAQIALGWYHDQLASDAQVLYLLARHFPERLAQVGAPQISALAGPIFKGSYTTHSSAWTILALETYGRAASAATDGSLTAAELVDGRPRALALPKSLLPMVPFSDKATAIRFGNGGALDAYYVVGERGFDRTLPAQPLSRKLEVFREYTDAQGKPVSSVKLGDEVQVHVRLRALGSAPIDQIAVVDLLPGGFEPVVQVKAKPEPSGEEGGGGDGEGEGEGEGDGEGAGEGAGAPGEPAAGTFALPIALPGSTFDTSFGDVREDRVVLYGTALPQARELVYAARATNTGSYVVPPVMADALYDRSVVARGVAGKITVTPR